MIKFAAVPVLAILAACSAEVESGDAAEANMVETLNVNNLVIAGPDTATALAETGTQVSPPAQQPQPAAPAVEPRAPRSTAAEPKQQTVREPSSEAAANSQAQTEAPAGTCTAEHRALGHC